MVGRYFMITVAVGLLCAVSFVAGGTQMLLSVERRLAVDCHAGIAKACAAGAQLALEWNQ